MIILVYILVTITLMLLIYLLLQFLLRGRLATIERLGDIQMRSTETESGLDVSVLTGGQEDYSPLFKLPVIGRFLKKSNDELVQAHIMMKPTEFLLTSLLSAASIFLLMNLLTRLPALALIFGILAFFLPKMYVSRAKEQRSKKLNNQLPELLNILSNGLRAGLSFTQALATSMSELDDPIRTELTRVLKDNSLGRPMEDALSDLVKRTRDEDIEMFVTAINIQLQVGGNLSQVLEMIADTIRDRVKLKGEIRTLTAQSRMSAIIIGLLPVGIALILSVLNPDYIAPLFTETLGRIMVVGAIIMTLIGAFLLRKISQMEV